MPAAARQKLFFALAASTAPVPLTFEGLKANPLVPGVSVISEGPAKGHSCYDEVNGQMVPMWCDATTLQTVMSAASTYTGGLRVNAGHFTGITEAAARLVNFRLDGQKLRADMPLFRTYSEFEHLCELVATIPDTFGLSIDFAVSRRFVTAKGLHAALRSIRATSCQTRPRTKAVFSLQTLPV